MNARVVLALALACGLFARGVAAAALPTATPRYFEIGIHKNAISAGDLNGDGFSDLVAPNFGTRTLSVMLGDRDGRYGPAVDYPTGAGPAIVAVSDVDRDGALDFVVTNSGDGSLTLLAGDGRGGFRARATIPTLKTPYFVLATRLNSDSLPDLVVTHLDSPSIRVLMGTGGGAFAPPVDYAVGSAVYSVAAADLDRDGIVDLATANYTTNTVSVLLGRGDGTFRGRTDFRTGAGPIFVEIRDGDADGRLDLMMVYDTPGSASVLLGLGDGSFGARADLEDGGEAILMAAGDLDSDGRLDAAQLQYAAPVALASGSDEDRSFVNAEDYWLGVTPSALVVDEPTWGSALDREVVMYFENDERVRPIPPDPESTPGVTAMLRATPVPGGVRVEWQLNIPEAVDSLSLQSGPSKFGPWAVAEAVASVRDSVFTATCEPVAAAGRSWYRLRGRQTDGAEVHFGPVQARTIEAPVALELSAPAPNPCTARSVIDYAVPERGRVRVIVTDAEGREIAVLADGVREQGRYRTTVSAGDLREGVYFVHLQAGSSNMVQRFLVTR